MATILVTGATGTLGSRVAAHLLDRHHQVRAFVREVGPAFGQVMQVYQGDLLEGRGVEEAVRGVDAIIHCATGPDDLAASRHLIQAATTNGSPHLIYISIVGIDRSSFSYYQTKLAVEQLIQQSGLPYSTVRTTQFHNFVLKIIATAEAHDPATITIPAGLRFQSIEINEVAQALTNLAEQKPAGQAPDMGGPQALTLEEMAQTYVQVYRKLGVVRAEPIPGEMYGVFRSGINIVPGRAVGRITWEAFLQQRAWQTVSFARS